VIAKHDDDENKVLPYQKEIDNIPSLMGIRMQLKSPFHIGKSVVEDLRSKNPHLHPTDFEKERDSLQEVELFVTWSNI